MVVTKKEYFESDEQLFAVHPSGDELRKLLEMCKRYTSRFNSDITLSASEQKEYNETTGKILYNLREETTPLSLYYYHFKPQLKELIDKFPEEINDDYFSRVLSEARFIVDNYEDCIKSKTDYSPERKIYSPKIARVGAHFSDFRTLLDPRTMGVLETIAETGGSSIDNMFITCCPKYSPEGLTEEQISAFRNIINTDALWRSSALNSGHTLLPEIAELFENESKVNPHGTLDTRLDLINRSVVNKKYGNYNNSSDNEFIKRYTVNTFRTEAEQERLKQEIFGNKYPTETKKRFLEIVNGEYENFCW